MKIFILPLIYYFASNPSIILKYKIENSLPFDDVLLINGHSKLLSSKASVNRKIIQKLGYNIPLLIAAMDKVTENQTIIFIVSQGWWHKNTPQENEF